MSTNQTTPPDPDKLKRLLALALDSSSADGEAMNALRAARKIVADLGGLDKALAAMKGDSAPLRDEFRSRHGGFGWEFRAYTNPVYGRTWDDIDPLKTAEERRRKQEADRKARERAEQEAKDAVEEARERREWELKRAMGQGLPIYEALRRRRLWKPGEAVDDGLSVGMEEEAEFMQKLRAAK